MNKDLLEKINNGEKINVEFKLAFSKLPSSLFETICAFLNRNGGYIFLGIDDNKNVVGVDKNNIVQMKKDFTNLCNNPQKIFPTVYLKINEFEIENKTVLYIYVHESSEVHKTNNKIFDRNEDGDYEITNNTNLIANMYIRKKNTYIENTIYPYATINDLRKDLIDKARKRAVNRTVNHPWGEMNDEELIKSSSLYGHNYQTGEEGINLAGILLLGKDEVISSVLPYYKTDALLRVVDIDRYDDRDDIRTNLIESFERLTAFISKHLSDKFYIEDNQSISIRDKIAREICANMLMHREFSNPSIARLIITKNCIYTENANKARQIGFIDINNYIPYPKNPIIAKFFKEIGYADELGSGIKKITKYTNIYSGGKPEFKEDDIFKVSIPINNIEQVNTYVDTQVSTQVNQEIINKILLFCNNPKSRKEIQEYVNFKNVRYFQKNILNKLIKAGLIEMIIKDHPKSRFQKYVTIKKR